MAAAPLYDFATLKRWRKEAGLTRERVCADLETATRGLPGWRPGTKTARPRWPCLTASPSTTATGSTSW